MYAVHTTLGFIIDSRPYGEAGKLISVFTRDFGLVLATAQGIRFERSKLRYFTQDYSFGSFSFVRGKEFWRLTSAQEAGSKEEGAGGKEDARQVPELIARVALLLRRLLHGEEANESLFNCVEASDSFMDMNRDLNEEQLKTLESLIVIRMMHHLGYIGDSKDLNMVISDHMLTISMLDELKEKRLLMNRQINEALKASHL